MNEPTLTVLEKAVEWAGRHGVPVILASTTGDTAEQMLGLMGEQKIPLIIINHESPHAPKDWWFSAEVRKKLKDAGHAVLPAKIGIFPPTLARWVTRTFGIVALNGRDRALEELLGTGGRVCFKIAKRATEKRLVHSGETVVAVAGKISGADTALALKVNQSHPPRISLLEIIARSPSDSF